MAVTGFTLNLSGIIAYQDNTKGSFELSSIYQSNLTNVSYHDELETKYHFSQLCRNFPTELANFFSQSSSDINFIIDAIPPDKIATDYTISLSGTITESNNNTIPFLISDFKNSLISSDDEGWTTLISDSNAKTFLVESLNAITDSFGFILAPTNPRSVSGLKFWYDLSTDNNLTLSSGVVSNLNDKAEENNLEQLVNDDRPSYISSSLNNIGGLDFSNGDDYLFSSESVSNRYNSSTGCFFFVVTTGTVDGSSKYAFAAVNSNGDFPYAGLRVRSEGFAFRFVTSGNTVTQLTCTTTSPQNNTVYLVTLASDGSTYSAYINNIAQEISLGDAQVDGAWFNWANDAPDSDFNALSLGAIIRQSSQAFWDGHIHEVIYYDNVILSPEEITNLNVSLMDKHNIA